MNYFSYSLIGRGLYDAISDRAVAIDDVLPLICPPVSVYIYICVCVVVDVWQAYRSWILCICMMCERTSEMVKACVCALQERAAS